MGQLPPTWWWGELRRERQGILRTKKGLASGPPSRPGLRREGDAGKRNCIMNSLISYSQNLDSGEFRSNHQHPHPWLQQVSCREDSTRTTHSLSPSPVSGRLLDSHRVPDIVLLFNPNFQLHAHFASLIWISGLAMVMRHTDH